MRVIHQIVNPTEMRAAYRPGATYLVRIVNVYQCEDEIVIELEYVRSNQ